MPPTKPPTTPTPKRPSAEPAAGQRAKAAWVDARLVDHYTDPTAARQRSDPLDGLIGTILSQHTSDLNSEAAFANLKRRFPTWEAVLAAPEAEVADAIRSGGLANVKAPRIRQVLRTLKDRHGRLDLDWLADEPLEAARATLLALDGVGPKTAACVLLFNLGLPAMPVDTHVHRVAGRLGLIPPGMSADAAHTFLERLIPPDRVYAVHLNLIRHGRQICHARRPRCGECPLLEECDYGRREATSPPTPLPEGEGSPHRSYGGRSPLSRRERGRG